MRTPFPFLCLVLAVALPACGISIHRLSDLDRAMDQYAQKARDAGKLGAFKCGLAYLGNLQFDNSSSIAAWCISVQNILFVAPRAPTLRSLRSCTAAVSVR